MWHVFGLVGKKFGESLEICSLIITFFHAGNSGIWTLNFAHLRIYTTDRWLSINKMSSSVSIIFWCYHLSFFTRFCLLSSFWSKLKTSSNVTNIAMTEDKSINKMRLISVTNAQLSKKLSPGTLSYSRVNRTFFPSQNISAWRQTPLDSSRRDTEVSHQPLRPDNKS